MRVSVMMSGLSVSRFGTMFACSTIGNSPEQHQKSKNMKFVIVHHEGKAIAAVHENCSIFYFDDSARSSFDVIEKIRKTKEKFWNGMAVGK